MPISGLSQKVVTFLGQWQLHSANLICLVFSFTELSVNYAVLSAGMSFNLEPQVTQGRAKASPMGRLAFLVSWLFAYGAY